MASQLVDNIGKLQPPNKKIDFSSIFLWVAGCAVVKALAGVGAHKGTTVRSNRLRETQKKTFKKCQPKGGKSISLFFGAETQAPAKTLAKEQKKNR